MRYLLETQKGPLFVFRSDLLQLGGARRGVGTVAVGCEARVVWPRVADATRCAEEAAWMGLDAMGVFGLTRSVRHHSLG